MRMLAALVLLMCTGLATAQEDLTVLKTDAGAATPRKMLYTYLLGQAQKHFDARRQTVAALKTPEDLKRRQERPGGVVLRSDRPGRTLSTAQQPGQTGHPEQYLGAYPGRRRRVVGGPQHGELSYLGWYSQSRLPRQPAGHRSQTARLYRQF